MAHPSRIADSSLLAPSTSPFASSYQKRRPNPSGLFVNPQNEKEAPSRFANFLQSEIEEGKCDNNLPVF